MLIHTPKPEKVFNVNHMLGSTRGDWMEQITRSSQMKTSVVLFSKMNDGGDQTNQQKHSK